MKRFNASKVRALGNLQPKSEKQKAFARRSNGIKVRWSKDHDAVNTKPKERDFLTIVKADFVPRKPRGRSGCRLNDATRARLMQRVSLREAFFASI